MRTQASLRPHRFPLLLAAVSAIALTLCGAHAQDPAPPAAPPPTTQPATPPAAPAPVPAEAPKPPAAEPPKKKEDEVPAGEQPGTANPKPETPSSLGTRVSAALKALQGQGAIVNQLAERDREIVSLRGQVTERDATITRLNAELVQLRSERAEIESAMRGLESRAATVTETVAALGFPASKLPATGTIEQVGENSAEGLQEQMKAEPSGTKRAEIAQRIIKLRDSAAQKKAANN